MQPSFQQTLTFWSNGYEVFKQVDRIHTRAWGKLNQQHLDLMRLCLDCGQRQFTAFTNGYTPQELLMAQSDIAREFTTEWADQIQSALTSATEAAREVAECLTGWLKPQADLHPLAEESAQPSNEGSRSRAARMKKAPA